MQDRMWGNASLKRYHLIRDLKREKKPAMWLCGGWMFQLVRTGKEASVTVQSEPGGDKWWWYWWGSQELEHEGSCRILFYDAKPLKHLENTSNRIWFIFLSLSMAMWRNDGGVEAQEETGTTAVIRVRNDAACTKMIACCVYMCIF